MTDRRIALVLELLADKIDRLTADLRVVILALAQEVEAFKRARKKDKVRR
jgi:hypothetical protein